MLRLVLVFLCCLALLASFVVWPGIDIAVSSFFASEVGFYWRENWFLNALAKIAFWGARLMALFFAVAGGWCLLRKAKIAGLSAKGWGFLLLCLLIGPGLIANVVLKDNWGRARPRDVVVFGGEKPFTPATYISQACSRNCSFVSGDASFGFFLPSIAYLVPRRRKSIVFWSTMGIGSVFACARIVLGAHFLSDVVYALAIVLVVSAGLHALMFSKRETADCWRTWLGITEK